MSKYCYCKSYTIIISVFALFIFIAFVINSLYQNQQNKKYNSLNCIVTNNYETYNADLSEYNMLLLLVNFTYDNNLCNGSLLLYDEISNLPKLNSLITCYGKTCNDNPIKNLPFNNNSIYFKEIIGIIGIVLSMFAILICTFTENKLKNKEKYYFPTYSRPLNEDYKIKNNYIPRYDRVNTPL